ncbi:hypothetical protein [Burkholderia glumae]|uniref:hypothetical protein n=1 Tax=Burkholderia glumae TaxID=337 RepID=UPI00156DB0D0|nr:hypothetical protein [Burkholderia glumae]MCM2485799.1 hypothetical protein [Burkholderia glumae]MCM2511637.1 hypothetical protein [Burkholderia glumae]QKM57604.1 hypothetical protein CG017_05683 [Burkholderia glumae]
MTLRFVVDETSWRFDGIPPADCIEALEEFLDRIDDAYEDGHDCCYSEDLFDVYVLGQKRFFDLCSEDSPLKIPQEVLERITSAFGRLQKWQDLSLPDDFSVTVGDGQEQFAPSIAWVHARHADGLFYAPSCLVFGPGRTEGCLPVAVQGVVRGIWFVGGRQSYKSYFRSVIKDFSEAPQQMEQLSRSAFPELEFRPGCFGGIKDMSKPYRELAEPIIRHLSVLSDQGARIFLGPRDRVSAEFGAFNVDISNENGNTKADKEALAERTKEFNGEDVEFLWHTKLERHCDRIHLSPDGVANGGKILIGIFCFHLK